MKNLMEVVFIIDRSGSMSGQESDIIGGFNAMIAKQKKEDYRALVSTVLFNGRTALIHDRIALESVTDMTEQDYCVYGNTALLDAIGENIQRIKMIHHYIREEDRPNKTLFVVMTDGMENASRRFGGAQIREMIREQENAAGWEFMFIGADIDAFASADDVGIHRSHTARMSKSEDSFTGSFDAIGDVMYRVAESEDKLQTGDWDELVRIFDSKKRRR